MPQPIWQKPHYLTYVHLSFTRVSDLRSNAIRRTSLPQGYTFKSYIINLALKLLSQKMRWPLIHNLLCLTCVAWYEIKEFAFHYLFSISDNSITCYQASHNCVSNKDYTDISVQLHVLQGCSAVFRSVKM